MNFSQDLILLGVIKSSHGINGHVIIKSFTNPSTNLFKRNLVNKFGESITIKLISKTSQGDFISKFHGIFDRNHADNLKGYKLFCLRDELPELSDEEFYITDLIHLSVVDEKLETIGKIKNVYNFGAGDIIEIEFLNHKTELLPFNKHFFPTITEKYVIVKMNQKFVE